MKILLTSKFDAASIKNLHEFPSTSITETSLARYTNTEDSRGLRKFLESLGIYWLSPAYMLNIGEEPSDPTSFIFIPRFWATTTPEQKLAAYKALQNSEYITEILWTA